MVSPISSSILVPLAMFSIAKGTRLGHGGINLIELITSEEKEAPRGVRTFDLHTRVLCM